MAQLVEDALLLRFITFRRVLIAWLFWYALGGNLIGAIIWGAIPLLVCNLVCWAWQQDELV